MTNEEITVVILDRLGWDYDKEMNPNRRSTTKPIWAGELILLVLELGTIPQAAKHLGIGEQTLNRVISSQFIPIFGSLNGGGETWKFKLLTYIEYKVCSSCRHVLSFSTFGKDSCSPTGRHSYCASCRVGANAISYKKPGTQEAHKRSQEKHYHNILARNALYRVERAKRSVAWADLDKIKEIYQKCPEGMHVDHIIPLKGELVSGLHVHTNLQYLSPEENMKKGNRYEV